MEKEESKTKILTDYISLVYMVIVITLVIIFIIFVLITYYNNKNNNEIKNSVDDEDSKFQDVSNIEKKYAPIKRKYNKIETIKFELGKKSEPAKNSQINYSVFKEKIKKDEFVFKFLKALIILYGKKSKIWNKIHKILHKDLQDRASKQGSLSNNDIKADRIKTELKQVEDIIHKLNQKVKNLNESVVRDNLYNVCHDPGKGLDSIVGRMDVKNFIIGLLWSFSENPESITNSPQNIRLYAGSGYGKTASAQIIANALCKSGILIRGIFRVFTPKDLKTAYVDESGNLTKDAICSCYEGMMLVDEAYDLIPPKTFGARQVSHGHESLTTIVNDIDKRTGLIFYVFAGYERDVEERIFGANEGMDRRFPNIIRLNPFNCNELTDILINFIKNTDSSIIIEEETADFCNACIEFIVGENKNIFSRQAGDMNTLGSCLLKTIYNSVNKKWINYPSSKEDLRFNYELLTIGFNSYLKFKNVGIYIKENINDTSENIKEISDGPPISQ